VKEDVSAGADIRAVVEAEVAACVHSRRAIDIRKRRDRGKEAWLLHNASISLT